VPSLRRGDLLDPVVPPQSIHATKSGNAAFRAHSCSSKNEEAVVWGNGQHRMKGRVASQLIVNQGGTFQRLRALDQINRPRLTFEFLISSTTCFRTVSNRKQCPYSHRYRWSASGRSKTLIEFRPQIGQSFARLDCSLAISLTSPKILNRKLSAAWRPFVPLLAERAKLRLARSVRTLRSLAWASSPVCPDSAEKSHGARPCFPRH